jgi:hypothetical protein
MKSKSSKITLILFIILLIGAGVGLAAIRQQRLFPNNEEASITSETTDTDAAVEDTNPSNGSKYFDFETWGLYQDITRTFEIDVRLPLNEDGIVSKPVADYGDVMLQDFLDSIAALDEDYRQEIQDGDAASWVLKVDFSRRESKTTQSLIIEGYQYTGGAHGLPFYKTFVFDKKSGELVSIEDIFTVNADKYLPELSAQAIAQFNEELGDSFFAEGADPDPNNWTLWYINGEELTFIFPPYQVGPYAAGKLELELPLSEIKSLVRDKYFGTVEAAG